MEPIKKQLRIFGAQIAVALLLSLISAVSVAELISLKPSATGSIGKTTAYTINGPFTYSLTTVNPLSSLGYNPPSGIGMVQGSSVAYGYLLFDLSALSFVANAASIEFNLAYARPAYPDLTVTGLTFAQALDLSTIPAGSQLFPVPIPPSTPEEQAAFARVSNAFDALAGGPALGQLAAAGPLTGSYTIGLNGQALDLINAGAGLLGVGLTWTPHSNVVPGGEPDPDTITFNDAPTLILNSQNRVPLPASTWLLGAGLLGLIRGKRLMRSLRQLIQISLAS
jgi:hypothetical protein